MKRAAIIYHSVEGHTAKIADEIARTMAVPGVPVDVFPLREAPASLDAYDGVVIGGSVHLGHHHRDLLSFIRTHVPRLGGRPTAFFSVSMTAAKDDDDSKALIREVVESFLDQAGWQPDMVAIFAGALPYTQFGFLKRHLVRQFARRMGHPTDTSRDYDFTDWEAVRRFAAAFVSAARPAAAS